MRIETAVKRFLLAHRRPAAVIAGLVLLPIVLYIAGETYRSIDYRERFAGMHGSLIEVDESPAANLDGHRHFAVSLRNDRGIRISGHMKIPADTTGRFPAFLILGGLRTGKSTLDHINVTRGVVLLALDYPYEGKRSGLSAGEFVSNLPKMRRAILQTVPAAMSAVDYLLQRDDVDPDRIILIGGSLGAFFVPAAAAIDGRIAAAAMLLGGADFQAIIDASLDIPGWIAGTAGWLGAVLVSPVEPLKYVSDISPRPVFILNATGDALIPERCGRLLCDAAAEPKTVRWIDAGHVTIREKEFHRLVSDELVAWLIEQNLVSNECYVPANSDQ